MINKAIDLAYAVKFLRILSSSWEDLDAYKTGVIDNAGNILVKKHEQTEAQKDSYSKFDVLVWNLKKLLDKVPFGKSALVRYSAALALLRENVNNDNEFLNIMENFYKYLEQNHSEVDLNMIKENFTTGIDMGAHCKPDEEHAGDAVFHVDSESFHKSLQGKVKYARYKTYVGEDDIGKKVKHYATRNPGKSVMLKDKQSGAMLYLRRK